MNSSSVPIVAVTPRAIFVANAASSGEMPSNVARTLGVISAVKASRSRTVLPIAQAAARPGDRRGLSEGFGPRRSPRGPRASRGLPPARSSRRGRRVAGKGALFVTRSRRLFGSSILNRRLVNALHLNVIGHAGFFVIELAAIENRRACRQNDPGRSSRNDAGRRRRAS